MKTIKQAAEEYANQERITRSEFGAFIDGVKFAQQWISVDEELPEESMVVLAKSYNGSIVICLFLKFKNKDKKDWFYRNEKMQIDIISWRPVERK